LGFAGVEKVKLKSILVNIIFLSKPIVNLSMNISFCPPHKSSQFFCRVFIFSHGNDLSGSQFREKIRDLRDRCLCLFLFE
jgi:hypothetical protein